MRRGKPGSRAGCILPVLEYCRWGWLHWLWEEIMSYQGFCYLLNHTEMSFCQANGTTLTEPLVPPESRHSPPPHPTARPLQDLTFSRFVVLPSPRIISPSETRCHSWWTPGLCWSFLQYRNVGEFGLHVDDVVASVKLLQHRHQRMFGLESSKLLLLLLLLLL